MDAIVGAMFCQSLTWSLSITDVAFVSVAEHLNSGHASVGREASLTGCAVLQHNCCVTQPVDRRAVSGSHHKLMEDLTVMGQALHCDFNLGKKQWIRSHMVAMTPDSPLMQFTQG